MNRRETGLLFGIALLVGVGVLYLGATGSCACSEQSVGQPAQFNQFQAEVAAGVVTILVSAVGLAFVLTSGRPKP